MKKLATVLGLGAMLALGGCFNATYVAKSRTPSMMKIEKRMDFFIAGLVGTGEVHVNQMCPQGAARIKTQHTFVDALLTIITIGIYTPRTAVVTCAQ